MVRRRFGIHVLAFFLIGATLASVAAADPPDASPSDAEAFFARRVLPILKTKCLPCHGDDREDIRGELDMRSRDGLLEGGESGEPSLVPGHPDQSPLFLAVTRRDELWSAMPPKENDQLSDQQIADLKSWILDQAVWPSAERIAELTKPTADQWDAADGLFVKTSGGLSDDWTNRRYQPEHLWAYQPLSFDRSLLRDAGNAKKNPVDVFIDKGLSDLGLPPAPLADRRTLIRRATFDLIGLPPTPQEMADFVNDPADDAAAFSKVVERLLASPHYGEQWGRHWLDIARYADSSGYANDYERGNAWRYRDYVIRSFNEDKPYDQFVREQIAGDEIDANNPEMLIAVGFLRMGPWELTGMEVAKVARQRFLDDVTDAVGQVFLAHMLQCARCHDHKFDPVPTRDYYAMQAVFTTTQLVEREAAFLPEENTSGFQDRKYLLERRQFYQETLDEVEKKRTLEAARQWYRDQGMDPAEFEQVLAELQQAAGDKPVTVDQVRKKMAGQSIHPDKIPPRHVGFEPRDFGIERIGRKGMERLKWRLDAYEPFALSVYAGVTPQQNSVSSPQRMPKDPARGGELEKPAILAGGDPFSPTEPVEPGLLSVVAMHAGRTVGETVDAAAVDTDHAMPTVPDNLAGRRTALADWIASADNPLTARVMVNRIWQWHFGQPIAGNPNNFGTTGKKPTHPQLLDYLATAFMESHWSVKDMHRLIMMSDAYRRSSTHPQPELLDKHDADRTSYAAFQPRRLDAEELRDSMLAVSGELNAELGGVPIRPEMNLEAALQPRMVMGTFAEAWQPSPLPEQRHRRSIYALRIRGQRDPFFEVFNAPNAESSCEARESSTITPQVFAMFNSEISFDRGLAMADRVLREAESDKAAVQRAIQLAYGRTATPDETEACWNHWREMTTRHESLHFPAPSYPAEVQRDAVEENTGEKFTFVEPLEVYADFVPDLKPADADARLRGLAELCLVLMNSNEFVYIY